MLSTTEAYAFTFRAIKGKPLFWLSIMLMLIISSIIADWQKDDVIVVVLLSIINIMLSVGIINVAIKAATDKEYSIKELWVKPEIYGRYIGIVALTAIASMLTQLPLLFGVVLLAFKGNFDGLIIGILIGITVLGTSYVLIRFWFAAYYLLHQNFSVWQCLKISWNEFNYKILLSLALATFWLMLIILPFTIIDKKLIMPMINITSPILLLSTVHLYMQLQWRKNKSEAEN